MERLDAPSTPLMKVTSELLITRTSTVYTVKASQEVKVQNAWSAWCSCCMLRYSLWLNHPIKGDQRPTTCFNKVPTLDQPHLQNWNLSCASTNKNPLLFSQKKTANRPQDLRKMPCHSQGTSPPLSASSSTAPAPKRINSLNSTRNVGSNALVLLLQD